MDFCDFGGFRWLWWILGGFMWMLVDFFGSLWIVVDFRDFVSAVDCCGFWWMFVDLCVCVCVC